MKNSFISRLGLALSRDGNYASSNQLRDSIISIVKNFLSRLVSCLSSFHWNELLISATWSIFDEAVSIRFPQPPITLKLSIETRPYLFLDDTSWCSPSPGNVSRSRDNLRSRQSSYYRIIRHHAVDNRTWLEKHRHQPVIRDISVDYPLFWHDSLLFFIAHPQSSCTHQSHLYSPFPSISLITL